MTGLQCKTQLLIDLEWQLDSQLQALQRRFSHHLPRTHSIRLPQSLLLSPAKGGNHPYSKVYLWTITENHLPVIS
jgi:hypothetical protein